MKELGYVKEKKQRGLREGLDCGREGGWTEQERFHLRNCFFGAGSGRCTSQGLLIHFCCMRPLSLWDLGGICTHRHREDQVRVPSKICDVPVERDPLLSCSSLAHSQGHSQDGIGSKLGWRKQAQRKGESFPPVFGVISSKGNVSASHLCPQPSGNA